MMLAAWSEGSWNQNAQFSQSDFASMMSSQQSQPRTQLCIPVAQSVTHRIVKPRPQLDLVQVSELLQRAPMLKSSVEGRLRKDIKSMKEKIHILSFARDCVERQYINQSMFFEILHGLTPFQQEHLISLLRLAGLEIPTQEEVRSTEESDSVYQCEQHAMIQE